MGYGEVIRIWPKLAWARSLAFISLTLYRPESTCAVPKHTPDALYLQNKKSEAALRTDMHYIQYQYVTNESPRTYTVSLKTQTNYQIWNTQQPLYISGCLSIFAPICPSVWDAGLRQGHSSKPGHKINSSSKGLWILVQRLIVEEIRALVIPFISTRACLWRFLSSKPPQYKCCISESRRGGRATFDLAIAFLFEPLPS